MKYVRNSLLFLAALALSAVLLLWFLPARWVLPWVAPQLHGFQLQQVRGIVWDGRAGQVQSPDGRPLGQLQWRLSRRALLGQIHLQFEFQGPQLAFNGVMRRLEDGRMQWRSVHLRADLGALDMLASPEFGQPLGVLRVTVDQARLQGGWPLQLRAQAQWQDAAMRTQGVEVKLGDLQLVAEAQGGVVSLQLHDDGHGPLQVDGQAYVSPIGWRLDAKLRSRQTDPPLRRWLGRFGLPDADGVVHLHRRAGLASNLPSPSLSGNQKP